MAERLFDYWDQNGEQRVGIEEFIKKMLLYGLCPNETYAKAIISLWKALINSGS